MLLTIKELFLTFTASLAVPVALHISGESVRVYVTWLFKILR